VTVELRTVQHAFQSVDGGCQAARSGDIAAKITGGYVELPENFVRLPLTGLPVVLTFPPTGTAHVSVPSALDETACGESRIAARRILMFAKFSGVNPSSG
jgi:hypothetical protein